MSNEINDLKLVIFRVGSTGKFNETDFNALCIALEKDKRYSTKLLIKECKEKQKQLLELTELEVESPAQTTNYLMALYTKILTEVDD